MSTEPGKTYGGLWYYQECLRKYGYSTRKSRTILLYLVKAVLDYPWMINERSFRSRRINNVQLRNDPVFIIGHYRSGTTFLHRILSENKNWNSPTMPDQFLPYYPGWLQKVLKPFLCQIIKALGVKHLLFNDYQLNMDEPVEEEMCLIGSLSKGGHYWGYLFPSQASHYLFTHSQEHEQAYCYLLKKITLKTPGCPLLLKNPMNTANIKKLVALFPRAKFIFLYRNPYHVFCATNRMWEKIDRYFAVQEISPQYRHQLIFDHYMALMEAYHQQKDVIPQGQLAEIKYECLFEDPRKAIDKIFEQLGIEIDESTQRRMDQRIAAEMDYTPNRYVISKKEAEIIRSHWGKYIKQWEYTSY